MLVTVQLLQNELTALSGGAKAWGTSKVAVVLPSSMQPGMERYAPQPVEEEVAAVKEELPRSEKKTTKTTHDNSQIDLVFDPLTEIPTLSHQLKGADNTEPEYASDERPGGKSPQQTMRWTTGECTVAGCPESHRGRYSQESTEWLDVKAAQDLAPCKMRETRCHPAGAARQAGVFQESTRRKPKLVVCSCPGAAGLRPSGNYQQSQTGERNDQTYQTSLRPELLWCYYMRGA